jgi:cysteinyl-tRNA synthetase
MQKLIIYNTLSRRKEEFKPLFPPYAGLYVCGPTVYGDPHLGHARPAITFDILFRYLKYLGFKVRYVRNITDVGHLENDADSGEDKISKKARLEHLEPMEIVQYYLNRYHDMMSKLNVLPPGIEPMASGHIIEQQQLVRKIIHAGFAYESNGSVYFDVPKYNEKHSYGKLSGRKTDDLLTNTRDLEGQDEKRNPLDFAIWKKAEPQHIMHWPSEWSEGFPGWHLECSAMSTKYLGELFDIHGGGIDLLFPHHECEIAQSVAASGKEPVKYWMHNNLITINGQKMGKSLGNFINLEDFFTGNNKLLNKTYSPMTVRFFILQAHYRSTLDFSNEALEASEKGLKRLFDGIRTLNALIPGNKTSFDIQKIEVPVFNALNDDLNTPIAIGCLFDGVKIINSIKDGKESISAVDLNELQSFYKLIVNDIIGLLNEGEGEKNNLTDQLIDFILKMRQEAKQNKDFKTSDSIREEMKRIGIVINDRKDGVDWGWE